MATAGIFYGIYILLLLILWPFCFFIEEQQQWEDFREQMNGMIDAYLGSHKISIHTHHLYRQIIEFWRKNNRDFVLSEISSYVQRTSIGMYLLIHSSVFQWDRLMRLSDSEEAELNDKLILKKEHPISSKKHSVEYLFLRKLNNSVYVIKYDLIRYNHFSPFESRAVEHLLRSISGRLVNLIAFTYEIKRAARQVEEQNISKKAYVDTAINTLHFIRNCLSPIVTLIDFLKLPKKERDTLQQAESSLLDGLIEAANNDYLRIKNHADKMLDTNLYPFSNTEVSEIPITTVYDELSEKVMGHLKIPISHNMDEDVPNVKVVVNLADLNTIFMDWIRNMEKYGRNFKVEWQLCYNELLIIFSNHSNEELRNLNHVVELLMNDSPETEHTRKKTHGIVEMRSRAAHNNILIEANVDKSNGEGRLNLILKIPTKHE
ncbi:MAG: hypothetical protein HDS84_04775 [Bacteroidales bacterium]|nr:hypothetical protein [Bacteroidales bacterium]MBD5205670.1 hypothetical protein [Bacteroidales bacterium]